MLERFKNVLFGEGEIEVYQCYKCGRLRTALEWKVKKERACRCGSIRVEKAYPEKMITRFWIKARIVLLGA